MSDKKKTDGSLSRDHDQEKEVANIYTADSQDAAQEIIQKGSPCVSKKESIVIGGSIVDDNNDAAVTDELKEKTLLKKEPLVCEDHPRGQDGQGVTQADLVTLSSAKEIIDNGEVKTELGVREKEFEKSVSRRRSGIDSMDNSLEIDLDCNSSSLKSEIEKSHSCDFHSVESPILLKNILTQYDSLSVDEEEVGCILPPKVICLPPYHLENINGCWVVTNNVGLDDKTSYELEDYDVFVLRGNVKVLFHRANRTWDVRRIEEDTIDQKSPIKETISTDLIYSTVPFDHQSSNEDAGSIEGPLEEDSSRATWKPKLNPRTISNCGQSFKPFDDSFEVKNQDFTEIQILEDAVQKVFYYIEKKQVLPDCLDDVKHPDVRQLVCVDLCSALNGVLKNGLTKKRTFFGATRYTVWEVVKGTSANDANKSIVKKINSLGPLEDDICFKLFVCECINHGSGALALWLASLQSDRKINSFYEDESLVIKLPKDTLEKLLSRITFLPFNITFFEHVKRKLKEHHEVTFAFE